LHNGGAAPAAVARAILPDGPGLPGTGSRPKCLARKAGPAPGGPWLREIPGSGPAAPESVLCTERRTPAAPGGLSRRGSWRTRPHAEESRSFPGPATVQPASPPFGGRGCLKKENVHP